MVSIERQKELREGIPAFVAEYMIRNRMIPTVGEVAEHFGASKATIHRYLEVLDEEGILPYRGRIGVPSCLNFEKT